MGRDTFNRWLAYGGLQDLGVRRQLAVLVTI